jgi:hypothetical protein
LLPATFMLHTFYAVFDDATSARLAAAELQGLRDGRDQPIATGSGTKPPPHRVLVSAILHRDLAAGAELHSGESAVRRGAASGAVVGGLLGAGAGLLAGPVVAGAGMAALIGGVLGFSFGGAMGGISTANGPDPAIESMARGLHDGQVLLTVEAPGLSLAEEGEAIVQRLGGRVGHRHIV